MLVPIADSRDTDNARNSSETEKEKADKTQEADNSFISFISQTGNTFTLNEVPDKSNGSNNCLISLLPHAVDVTSEAALTPLKLMHKAN